MEQLGVCAHSATSRTLRDRDDGVRELGSRIGYGYMMHRAQQEWREHLRTWPGGDISGGEFAIGPCVGMTVPCICMEPGGDRNCDYCCGCGWVTGAVKKLICDKERL